MLPRRPTQRCEECSSFAWSRVGADVVPRSFLDVWAAVLDPDDVPTYWRCGRCGGGFLMLTRPRRFTA